MNASINTLNVYNITLYNESNACGIIDILFIESTLKNDYIHILNYTSKKYIYGYLISRLIASEATIQIHNTTNHIFTTTLGFLKNKKTISLGLTTAI